MFDFREVRALWAGGLWLAAACAGPGTTPSPVTCGPDTLQVGTECRPRTLVRCGDGTTEVDGACVPVSTLTCGEGTVEKDGACAPASVLKCGAGTEERDGLCVTIDPLRRITVREADEPNGPPARATRFQLPAIGEPPAVLGGTITSILEHDGEGDLDGFIFSAAGLTRLRITPTAVGVPSVGFGVNLCKPPEPGAAAGGPDTCELDGRYQRFGLTIEARETVRELVLPVAGDYIIFISDAQNLTGGLPMGGKTFTYTVDVAQLPQPAPVAVTPDVAATGRFDTLIGHSFDVTADARLYDLILAPQPESDPFVGQRALWAVGADGHLAATAYDITAGDSTIPIRPVRAAFAVGTARVFVDYLLSLLEMPTYTLQIKPVPVVQTDLTAPYQHAGSLSAAVSEVYALDVNGGTVLTADLTPDHASQANHRLELRDANYEIVIPRTASRTMIRYVPVASGRSRFYLVVTDVTPAATRAQAGYQANYTLALSTPPAELVGPVSAGQPSVASGRLGPTGRAWYAVIAGADAIVSAALAPKAPTPDANLAIESFVNGTPPLRIDATGTGGTETTAGRYLQVNGALLVQVQGLENDEFDLTASATAPVPVPLDPTTGIGTANATFTSGSDMGLFSFELAAAQGIRIATSAAPNNPNVDTVVSLLDASGQLLDKNDDCPGGGTFSCLTRTLAAGR